MIKNISELAELPEMLESGMVSMKRHPELSLRILNYTARAQYANAWNETTLTCRGLIVNDGGDVVARPFRKFFNLEQVESLPHEPFDVFEKLDGSLGILYWNGDTPLIATRGSFDSEQAQFGTKMIQAAPEFHPKFDRSLTYLFEIIYPENRIVVDYGDSRRLALLGAVETETGKDIHPCCLTHEWWDRAPRSRLHPDNPAELKSLDLKNKEGFVIRFDSGFRVKVKLAEYVRLHKLLTGLNERTLLRDYLMPGNDIGPLLERTPDEFNDWIRTAIAKLQGEYRAIEAAAREEFVAVGTQPTRKDYALKFAQSPRSAVLFKMLDGRPYDEVIWRQVQADVRPFACADEATA